MPKRNLETLEEHNEVFEQTLEAVKNMFNSGDNTPDDGLTPMIQVVDSSGDMTVVALAVDFEESAKDMVEQLMVSFALEGAKSIAFWSEAWMAHMDKGQLGTPPREHPNRIEVVNVMYACEAADRCASAKIYRPPGGRSFISDWNGTSEMLPMDWQPPGLHGRFQSPFLKAERFRRIAESRKPGYTDEFIKFFRDRFISERQTPDEFFGPDSGN